MPPEAAARKGSRRCRPFVTFARARPPNVKACSQPPPAPRGSGLPRLRRAWRYRPQWMRGWCRTRSATPPCRSCPPGTSRSSICWRQGGGAGEGQGVKKFSEDGPEAVPGLNVHIVSHWLTSIPPPSRGPRTCIQKMSVGAHGNHVRTLDRMARATGRGAVGAVPGPARACAMLAPRKVGHPLSPPPPVLSRRHSHVGASHALLRLQEGVQRVGVGAVDVHLGRGGGGEEEEEACMVTVRRGRRVYWRILRTRTL